MFFLLKSGNRYGFLIPNSQLFWTLSRSRVAPRRTPSRTHLRVLQPALRLRQLCGRLRPAPPQLGGRLRPTACPAPPRLHGRLRPAPPQLCGRLRPAPPQLCGRLRPAPLQLHGRPRPALHQLCRVALGGVGAAPLQRQLRRVFMLQWPAVHRPPTVSHAQLKKMPTFFGCCPTMFRACNSHHDLAECTLECTQSAPLSSSFWHPALRYSCCKTGTPPFSRHRTKNMPAIFDINL